MAALRKEGVATPDPVPVSALIDTGASCTVIQEAIATNLGIRPVGQMKINTPSCEGHLCFKYAVTFLLPTPDGGMVMPVRFTETVVAAPLGGQNIQCLLGRDFLQHVMLVYNGPKDSFYFAM